MGNKCGRHAEVKTLSRRNSRQDLGPVEAQILKKKKKQDKKNRRLLKKKKKQKKSRRQPSFSKGVNQIPLEYQNGAAWRIRTFSESSVHSDTSYFDAEEEELSLTDDESILSLSETGQGYLSFWPFGNYILNKFFGSEEAQTDPEPPAAASNWDVKLRSLSKASRKLDPNKGEVGSTLSRAAVPLELSQERGLECEKHCWDQPKGDRFPLRGKNYLKDRKKIKSSVESVYKLKSVDIYRSDVKVDHIAQRLQLPSTETIPEDCPITPLLVINWQAPMYPPKLFGTVSRDALDGESLNVVAIFSLSDGFVGEKEIEKGTLYPHTLELLKRFCAGVVEEDGGLSRERLKMIPAMPNLDEWCGTGTFGRTEQAILRKWQNKPMLVRPQYKCFVGPEYIEVDINIHCYQYATRRYFNILKHTLQYGVMDMALTLEGRNMEQLPEQIIASIRLQKIDFLSNFPTVPSVPPIHHHLNDNKNSNSNRV